MSAIGGGVGGGLGQIGNIGSLGATGSAIVKGAVGSAVTQGIGVATGLQKSFDWAGVAVAGVGAGVGSWVGGEIGYKSIARMGDMHNNLLGGVAGAAGMIANAATRSLVNDSNFGDNIIAALPDTIGQTIGNLVAGGIQRAERRSTAIDALMAAGLSKEDARSSASNFEMLMDIDQDGMNILDQGRAGGVLASAQALVTGSKAMVFNASGLNSETVARHNASMKNADRLVTSVHTDGELLTYLQTPGLAKYLPSELWAFGAAGPIAVSMMSPAVGVQKTVPNVLSRNPALSLSLAERWSWHPMDIMLNGILAGTR